MWTDGLLGPVGPPTYKMIHKMLSSRMWTDGLLGPVGPLAHKMIYEMLIECRLIDRLDRLERSLAFEYV